MILIKLGGSVISDKEKEYSFHKHIVEQIAEKIQTFLEKGLPAYSVSSSSIFLIENKEIIYGEIEILRKLLELKFIPILFGDTAIALDKGIDILSGDQIVSYLAKMLKPNKVIFLMDVDGIYDRNPKEKDAKLIEELNAEEIRHLLESSESAGIDVTGGIGNKLREALKIAKHSEVYFINGKVRENLSKAIKGQRVGTRLKF